MTDYTDTILTPDVREILQSEYERSNIQSIFKNILIPDFEYRSNSISHQCNLLGEFTEIGASKHLELAVYEINLVPHAYKKRIFITQQVFKILREFKRDNSIVIFNTGDGKYRLSLFTSKWEYNPITSKVSNTPSNQRRFSFPLGIGTKIKTPYEFLIKKGKINDVNELLERFSLQLLNKQFYEEMQRVFTQLTGGEFLGVKHKVLLKLKYRDPPSIDSPNVVTHMRLAIKLISRIIVCKFLCEMKSENGLPLMNEELLSEDAVIESKGNYYYDVLMPLFFEVLNRSQEDRLDSIKTDPRYTNIPCLSGGLFSPQVDDGYANSERGAVSDVDVFIPNSWLATFFGILNEYNFIPDENTPYDSEISIDPEMLGQIFENLLATIDPDTDESARKSTGSFYTPREIVDYMVSASICEYLKSKTGIKEYLLRNLISYESANETLFKLSIDDVSNIVSALSELTLLDPACGSGAFPIGALQKIIYILEQIDGNGVLLLDNRIEAHEGTAQDNILDVSNRPSGSLNYIRKLRVIQNTLFGVDIQPVAIEISKIRCFISLIIEESIDDSKPNRDIIPLPNLDFKFVVANSLISLSEDYEIIHSEKTDNCLERLKSLRKQFFSQSNINNQLVLAEFLNEGSEILKEQQRLGNKSADLERLTSWLPFAYLKNEWVDFEWMLGTSKFDLIIGNPPYIHIERMSRAEKSNFLRQVSDIRGKFRTVPRYKTLESRGDVYCLFYEQGINLLKDDGFLIYITSNKWMTSTYGEKLRNLFLEYTNPISFVDLGSGRFSSAAVDTAILLLQNCPNLHQLKAVTYRGTNLNQLYKYVDTSFNVDFELGQPWTILDNMDRIIKEKIDSCATPLSKLNLKLHRGILTGYNDAFIISGVTREKILEKCSSETDRNKTASIMRPVLRGRNINRGSYNWGGEYLIVTHNGYPTEDGDYIPPIDINEYPALKKHFDIYFDQLSIRLDKGKTPYNLRNCLYMADFDKPKLFWSEIAQKPSFAFSNENIMIVNSCFMITNPPIGLVDILNSKLIEWYFPKIATSIGNSVAICYFKSFVQNIPIPLKIEEKRYSEDEIFELYGLNSDEISYVLESLGEYS